MEIGNQCQFHSNGRKIMFCCNLSCKSPRNFCPACVEDFHSNHHEDVISLYPMARFSKLNRLIIHSEFQTNTVGKIIRTNIREYIKLANNFCDKLSVSIEGIMQDIKRFVIEPCIALQESFQHCSLQNKIIKIMDPSTSKEELDFIALAIHKFNESQLTKIGLLQQIVILSMDKLSKNIDFYRSITQKFQSKIKKWGLFEVPNWKERIVKEKQKIQKELIQEQKIKELLKASKNKLEFSKNQKLVKRRLSAGSQSSQQIYNNLIKWGKFIQDSKGKQFSLQEWYKNGKTLSDIQIVNLSIYGVISVNRKLQQFPQEFKKLKNVKCLYLDNNKLETTAQLQQFAHLQMLSITNNCLKDIDGLKKMPHLKTVYIYNNHLPAQIIEEIGQLNKKGYFFYCRLIDTL